MVDVHLTRHCTILEASPIMYLYDLLSISIPGYLDTAYNMSTPPFCSPSNLCPIILLQRLLCRVYSSAPPRPTTNHIPGTAMSNTSLVLLASSQRALTRHSTQYLARVDERDRLVAVAHSQVLAVFAPGHGSLLCVSSAL